jgi:hypothetical protein
MAQPQDPGFMAALADALRRYTGMTGTADPSVAGAARTLQGRPHQVDMQIKANEMGMTPEQYQQMLMQQGQR